MSRRRGRVIGRVVLTTALQGGGAPLVDRAAVEVEGHELRAPGWAIVAPWWLRWRRARPRLRTEQPAPAFVIAVLRREA